MAAANDGYGFFGDWSVGHDQPCPNNGAYVFASTFKKFDGKWGAGVTHDEVVTSRRIGA